MALRARKIILVFTKMRDFQLQKSLRMKKIFACRNPKPSVALRCMLPAVEKTQGTQFCQGEQNVCFGFGLGLGKVRGMFCLVLVSVLVLVLVLPRNGKVLVIVCRRVFLEVNNNQTWYFGLNKLILVSNTELNTFKEPRRRHLQGCC